MAKKNNKEVKEIKKNSEVRSQKKERMEKVEREPRENLWRRISEETRQGILSIISLFISIFLVAAAFDFAGVAGRVSYQFLHTMFGTGYFLFPAVFFLGAIAILNSVRANFLGTTIGGGVVFLLSSMGIVDAVFRTATDGEFSGGLIGYYVGMPLITLLDKWMAILLLSLLSIIAVLVMFSTSISLAPTFFGRKLWGVDEEDGDEESGEKILEEVTEVKLKGDESEKKAEEKKPEKPAEGEKKGSDNKTNKLLEALSPIKPFKSRVDFVAPPLSLLERESEKPTAGDIKANANIIKRTLFNFGIDVEMDEISIGPSITRYALKPAEGIKLGRITALNDNLSLALAAHPIRIEAPIPGRSLVGIEIPNTHKATVRLESLITAKKFIESREPLLAPLGKGVSGIPYFTNIAKAPHMLVAGTTGSGKSVTIHSIITALLYRNPPEMMRFILVDPKRVELTLYNGIPHLLTPVITDPKKTILALRWAAKEMDRRYNILEKHAVKNIQSYHENIVGGPKVVGADAEQFEQMPYILIIVDELADIMATYPRELEAGIVRLAQMSRATGIHLILSTQRPSVEVITGLIKANIPSRIALQVPSQIDSRTILDMPGAEKLLGAGDMLYLSGDTPKPHRVQSAFISENEVKRVVAYLKEKYRNELPDEITITENKDGEAGGEIDLGRKPVGSAFGEGTGDGGFAVTFDEGSGSLDDNGDDEVVYQDARKTVVEAGKASTSFLQRKLKLGYARASRIMDMLEERGIIGPGEGAKQRDVYEKPGEMGRIAEAPVNKLQQQPKPAEVTPAAAEDVPTKEEGGGGKDDTPEDAADLTNDDEEEILNDDGKWVKKV